MPWERRHSLKWKRIVAKSLWKRKNGKEIIYLWSNKNVERWHIVIIVLLWNPFLFGLCWSKVWNSQNYYFILCFWYLMFVSRTVMSFKMNLLENSSSWTEHTNKSKKLKIPCAPKEIIKKNNVLYLHCFSSSNILTLKKTILLVKVVQ